MLHDFSIAPCICYQYHSAAHLLSRDCAKTAVRAHRRDRLGVGAAGSRSRLAGDMPARKQAGGLGDPCRHAPTEAALSDCTRLRAGSSLAVGGGPLAGATAFSESGECAVASTAHEIDESAGTAETLGTTAGCFEILQHVAQ
eukprot:3925146-Pleurochrysis_carterae.AAC.2